MNATNHEKNMRSISELSKLSDYHMDRLPGGREFLCIDNENLLPACAAVLIKDTRHLLVFGIDENERFISKAFPVLIFDDKLYDFVADAVEQVGVIGFRDVGLAALSGVDPEPYSVECSVTESTAAIASLEFIKDSYSAAGFKFGITLENGSCGEIVVRFGSNSRELMIDDIEHATVEMRSFYTDKGVPGIEKENRIPVISVAGFDIVLDEQAIAMLHLFSSFVVELD